MYESASQFGVFSSAGSVPSHSHLSAPHFDLEDSYAQLNIKKSTIDTPPSLPNSARYEAVF